MHKHIFVKTALMTLFIFSLLSQSLFSQPFPVPGADGKFVIVSVDGKIINTTIFPLVEPYFEGFAVASDLNSWFFLDTNGNKAFNQDFAETMNFSEGLAPVKIDEKWGYINSSGKIAIKPQFTRAFPFSGGLACVMTGSYENETATYGYIDKSGKIVIKPFLKFYDNQFFAPPTSFKGDLAAGWFNPGGSNMPVGFFDKTGKTVISPRFGGGDSFSEGLAPVAIGIEDGPDRYGYINKQGEFVIKPQFFMAHPFSEGVAAVCENDDEENQQAGKWGYIDHKGEWVIPPIFTVVQDFHKGFASVHFDDSGDEGFIRKDGSIVIRTSMLQKILSGTKNRKARVASVEASSFLPPSKSGKIDYKPENLIDNNVQTAWIEGNRGNGIGEWIKLNLSENQIIDAITIHNGYQRIASGKRDPFTSNVRPAKIRLTISEKEIITELKDEKGPQFIELGGLKSNFVKIEILSVHHKGNEDPDCGFSEVEIIIQE